MRLFARLVSLLLVCALFAPSLARAQDTLRGIALVVGNDAYEALTPLSNPGRDAEAIEELLSDLGFDTELSTDRNGKRLKRDLDNFLEDAETADVALFYYAGHGIDAGGENYLVPVDADPENPVENVERLVPLSGFLTRLRATVPVAIVLMDACRNSPFPSDFRLPAAPGSEPLLVASTGLGVPVITRGFLELDDDAGMSAPDTENVATLIGYAAEPGQAALDGAPGANSPYAAALLRHVGAMTGDDFSTVMSMVTEEVYLKTSGRQQPWVNQSLRRRLFFGTAQKLDPENAALVTERRSLLVHIAALPVAQRVAVETLAQDGGVPMDVVFAVMRAAGIAADEEPAAVEARLRNEIARFAEVRASRTALMNPDPEILRLTQLADEAELEGALQTADHFRDQAKERVVAARATREQQVSALRDRVREDAEVYERSAETKELLFRPAAAAADYGEAFRIIAQWDPERAFHFRLFQLAALATAADIQANEVALAELARLTQLEIDTPTIRWTDLERAHFEKLAGHAAVLRFNRSDDPADLDLARAHYEQALELHGPDNTRETAVILGDLGGLAFNHGLRTNNVESLEAAAAQYASALEMIDPGNALTDAMLAFDSAMREHAAGSPEVRDSSARLEEIVSREGGIQQFKDWIWIQAETGAALSNIGTMREDTQMEDQAIYAYYLAIAGYRAAGEPEQTARIATNRGNLYGRRAARGLTENATDAFDSYVEALEVISASTHPAQYIKAVTALTNLIVDFPDQMDEAAVETAIGYLKAWRTESNVLSLESRHGSADNTLGRLHYMLGGKSGAVKDYRAAVAAFEAFETAAAEGTADQAIAAKNLGLATRQIGMLGDDAGELQVSIAHLERARAIYEALGDAAETVDALRERGISEHEFAIRNDLSEDYTRAAQSYEAALAQPELITDAVGRANLRYDLGQMYAQIGRVAQDPASLRAAAEAFDAAAQAYAEADNATDRIKARYDGIRAWHDIAYMEEDATAMARVVGLYRQLIEGEDDLPPTLRAELHSGAALALGWLAYHAIDDDPAFIVQSKEAFASAVDLAREGDPAAYGLYLGHFASAAISTAERTGAWNDYEAARAAYDELLRDQHADVSGLERANWHNNLAYALVLMNRLRRDDAGLDRATDLAATARRAFIEAEALQSLPYAQATSCDALNDSAARDNRRDLALEAKGLCENALTGLRAGQDVRAVGIAEETLRRVEKVLARLPE